MNNPSSRPTRAANETNTQYERRLHRYIRQHAPQHARRYLWVFNTGRPWQRYVIPSMYYLAALIVTIVMVGFLMDFRNLSGPKSATGDFAVVDLSAHTTEGVNGAAATTYIPNVEVRGEKVEIFNSAGHEFEDGTPITLQYTTEGKRLAAFAGEDGTVPLPTGFLYVFLVPVLFAISGLLIQFVYKGRVNDDYRKKAVEALKKGKDLPKN